MKVEVKIRFRDIHTKELREPGDIIECTKERYEEIISKRPLVDVIKEAPVTDDDNNEVQEDDVKADEETKKDDLELTKLTVTQLKAFAKANEIDIAGAKTKKKILDKMEKGA